jgi:curved DNA-binding protein CbpA
MAEINATATGRNYYEVLGVAVNASVEAIHSAYRRTALAVHPDKNFNARNSQREANKENFLAATKARDCLADANRRAEYDSNGFSEIQSSQQSEVGGSEAHSPLHSDGESVIAEEDNGADDEDDDEEGNGEEEEEEEEEGGNGLGVGEDFEAAAAAAAAAAVGDNNNGDGNEGGSESESEADVATQAARNWKHALFLAVSSVERNAQTRFKEAGALLDNEGVSTADQAQLLVEDIRKFIRKGFPQEEQNFLKRPRGELTSSGHVRRNGILSKERTYYKRFFKEAYGVDGWGVTGKRPPRPPPPGTPPPGSPLPDAPQPPVETWIYVLRLVGNKKYIGSTTNKRVRLLSHLSLRSTMGSAWTALHKPVVPLDFTIRLAVGSPGLDEDKETKEQMKIHGIDNVRGGTYCLVDLDANTKHFLERELRHDRGACFKCGSTTHLANACSM